MKNNRKDQVDPLADGTSTTWIINRKRMVSNTGFTIEADEYDKRWEGNRQLSFLIMRAALQPMRFDFENFYLALAQAIEHSEVRTGWDWEASLDEGIALQKARARSQPAFVVVAG